MKPIYLLLAILFFACQQDRSKDRVEQIAHDTMVIEGDTLAESIVMDTIPSKLILKEPHGTFIKDYSGYFNNLKEYLAEYYALVKDTVKVDNKYHREYVNYICEYYLYYEYGISLYFNNCQESGDNVTIKLPYAEKGQVVEVMNKLLKPLVKSGNMFEVWNKDTTEFSPSGGGAGCNYKLKQVPDTVIVSYYCGC